MYFWAVKGSSSWSWGVKTDTIILMQTLVPFIQADEYLEASHFPRKEKEQTRLFASRFKCCREAHAHIWVYQIPLTSLSPPLALFSHTQTHLDKHNQSHTESEGCPKPPKNPNKVQGQQSGLTELKPPALAFITRNRISRGMQGHMGWGYVGWLCLSERTWPGPNSYPRLQDTKHSKHRDGIWKQSLEIILTTAHVFRHRWKWTLDKTGIFFLLRGRHVVESVLSSGVFVCQSSGCVMLTRPGWTQALMVPRACEWYRSCHSSNKNQARKTAKPWECDTVEVDVYMQYIEIHTSPLNTII